MDPCPRRNLQTPQRTIINSPCFGCVALLLLLLLLLQTLKTYAIIIPDDGKVCNARMPWLDHPASPHCTNLYK
jgi:hypothetical protein